MRISINAISKQKIIEKSTVILTMYLNICLRTQTVLG